MHITCCVFVFFFFKQKTAYEMRISDWSSDVCSSDLDRSERPRSRPCGAACGASAERAGNRPHAYPSAGPRTRLAGDAARGHRALPAGGAQRPAYHALGSAVPALPCHQGRGAGARPAPEGRARSEEHTSELQSLMRTSSVVFCLKIKLMPVDPLIIVYQTIQ